MSSTLMPNESIASGFKGYRLAGVQIASLEQQQAAQEQTRENFSQALQDGRLDVSKLRSPSSPVIPVYVDDDGQQFLGIPTALGPRMYPLENAVPFDHSGNPAAGGFWSSDAINELKNAPSSGDPQAMSSMMTQAAQRALPQAAGSDGASLVESFLKSTVMGIGQQVASEGLSMLAGASNPNGLINQFVAAPGSGVNLAQIGQNLASGLIGNLMSMGIQAAMSGWQVDDESSTAEHVAHQAVQALIGKLQGELMNAINNELAAAFGNPVKNAADSQSTMDKIKEFFSGPTSTACVPVGRIGDADTNDGVAVMGAATVFANGLKVTRYGDGVTMTNPSVDLGPLQSGNPVILTCTLSTAGEGHFAVGVSKGIVTLLDSCSPNVFMGPQGMPDVKPTPKRQKPTGNSSNADPKNQPTSSGNSDSQGVCINPKKHKLAPQQKKMVIRAIDNIKKSDFGKTDEGKRVVAELENKVSNGDIKIVPECAEGGAHYSPSDKTINLEDRNFDNPRNLERTLVHEGTHAIDDLQFPGSGHSIETEMRAHENELIYYAEQRKNGAPSAQDMDAIAKAYTNSSTRDEFGTYLQTDPKLRTLYGDNNQGRYSNGVSQTYLHQYLPPRNAYPPDIDGLQQYQDTQRIESQRLQQTETVFENQRDSQVSTIKQQLKQIPKSSIPQSSSPKIDPNQKF